MYKEISPIKIKSVLLVANFTFYLWKGHNLHKNNFKKSSVQVKSV